MTDNTSTMPLRGWLEAVSPPERHYGEGDHEWTDRAVREGAARGINRWCSFGHHESCSDPDGDRCRCVCHRSDAPSYGDLARWLKSELDDGHRLRGGLVRAVDEGRNVLPDATDDQAHVIEAWAVRLLDDR